MKKLIIRSNEWYKNMTKTEMLFFIWFIITVPILITTQIGLRYQVWWPWDIVIGWFVTWRILCRIILWRENHKTSIKSNNEEPIHLFYCDRLRRGDAEIYCHAQCQYCGNLHPKNKN